MTYDELLAEVKRLRRELAKAERRAELAENERDVLGDNHKQMAKQLADLVRERDEAAERMRERAAVAFEKRAVEIGRQECCGFGVGSPPECCADPIYMISNVEGAAAIRALPVEMT